MIGSSPAIAHKIAGAQGTDRADTSAGCGVVHAELIGDLLLGVAVLEVSASDACSVVRAEDNGGESRGLTGRFLLTPRFGE